MSTKERIYAALKNHFSPIHLVVNDESGRHKNHAGAKESGGGHYAITLVADSFSGKTLIERHRVIHDCLKKEIGTSIHALAIKTYTLAEYKNL